MASEWVRTEAHLTVRRHSVRCVKIDATGEAHSSVYVEWPEGSIFRARCWLDGRGWHAEVTAPEGLEQRFDSKSENGARSKVRRLLASHVAWMVAHSKPGIPEGYTRRSERAGLLMATTDMQLPPGKTCADCYHLKRCTWLISVVASNTHCDWSPSRFVLAEPTPESPPSPGSGEPTESPAPAGSGAGEGQAERSGVSTATIEAAPASRSAVSLEPSPGQLHEEIAEGVSKLMTIMDFAEPQVWCPICQPNDIDPNCQHHGPKLTQAQEHAVDVLNAKFDRS